jgi:ABC-2 type transport system permease protein
MIDKVRTLAVTERVLRQLRHDHRTIALVLLVPSILMILMYFVFDEAEATFESFAPLILGLFPLIVMFLVTSVAMLRERTAGTLERLMTMPIGKIDLLAGYALAFGALALLQGVLASWVTFGLLGVDVEGGAWKMLIIAVLAGITGSASGLFFSAFAKTEFQAVQFMPAFVFPQILTCGLFVARDKMAEWLQTLSDFLPLTYVIDAMNEVATNEKWTSTLTKDLFIILLFAVGALLLGAATLRRSHK